MFFLLSSPCVLWMEIDSGYVERIVLGALA